RRTRRLSPQCGQYFRARSAGSDCEQYGQSTASGSATTGDRCSRSGGVSGAGGGGTSGTLGVAITGDTPRGAVGIAAGEDGRGSGATTTVAIGVGGRRSIAVSPASTRWASVLAMRSFAVR